MAWAVPPHCVPGVGAAALGAVEGGVSQHWQGLDPTSTVLAVPLHEPLAGRWGFPAWQPWHHWHRSRCPSRGSSCSIPWGAGPGAGGSGIDFPQKQDTAAELVGLLPAPGKRSRGWGWEWAGSWFCPPGGLAAVGMGNDAVAGAHQPLVQSAGSWVQSDTLGTLFGSPWPQLRPVSRRQLGRAAGLRPQVTGLCENSRELKSSSN